MFEALLAEIHTLYGINGLVLFIIVLSLIKWHDYIKIMFSKLITILFRGTPIFSPRAILLSKLTYWIDFKIERLKLSDKGRTLVFRDLLYIYFTEIKEHVFDIEKQKDFKKLGRRELFIEVVECIYAAMQSVKQRAKNEGIPDIVIDKFMQWHQTSVDFIIKSSELISQSPVYKSNLDVICAIYLLYTASLELIIVEGEKTLAELNGELTGIEYKDIIIGE
jgi:hypothetical protein